MDDLLREFLNETGERLDRLDRELVALERDPTDPGLLQGIFRTLHTIKGTCSFLALERLEAVAHAAEGALGAVREGRLPLNGALVSDVLSAADAIRSILESLAEGRGEGPGGDPALLARLARWGAGRAAAEGAPEALSASSPAAEAREAPGLAGRHLRVHVESLDRLVALAEELACTRDLLLSPTANEDADLRQALLRKLDRVADSLQAAARRTRVEPVGNAWRTAPRLVRDLCRVSGKRIELVTEGGEIELDRRIVQAIHDPVTHMVRNAADHGIEPPALRRAAGKPGTGTIRLAAARERGEIVVEVRDDGQGLDADAIRRKAVQRGLVRPGKALSMSEREIYGFVFAPGVSTAERVTSVSGRGVGMDVVRADVEEIGGSVELVSVPGAGTTVRLRIPLGGRPPDRPAERPAEASAA